VKGEQVETGSRSFATEERDQDKRMPDSGSEEMDSESKAVQYGRPMGSESGLSTMDTSRIPASSEDE